MADHFAVARRRREDVEASGAWWRCSRTTGALCATSRESASEDGEGLPVRRHSGGWPRRILDRSRSSSSATSRPRTTCFDIFSPPPGHSEVISHVDRLSSNETKIAPRSVRIVGASGRSATVCMLASRVGGSNLTLPKCGRYPPPHGILKENLLWVRTFDTIEELRAALVEFARHYNETWLVARHGNRTR